MAGAEESTDLDHQVLTEAISHMRIVTLNRPRKLNAISFHMIYQLTRIFTAYENDDDVKLVLLKGSGRSFCAGSDVAEAIAYLLKDGNWRFVSKCYADEYTLDYLLATLRTPQVSILNGIVMGGGAGISIHGRFRIATENAVFAMPETALGLFPDIGSSYFLSRLPGFFGEYCALTGARLNGSEMFACGLATHYVPSKKLPSLEEKLSKIDVADPNVVSTIIQQFSEAGQLESESALHRMDTINKCFSKRSVEEIFTSLEQLASTRTDEWIKKTIWSLKAASPTGLKVTLRSVREGRLQSLSECLIREHRMLCHYLRRDPSNDFFEGCRALLLEKDKNPKWEPSKLEMVSDEMVDKIFSRIDDDEWEELKLPPKFGIHSTL